ncbi:hypothetical protein CRG98_029838 [Punica granatum]|uniref:GH16 domain-containing protein n=1 Tax=Punica granatum TaxID=22663 RepID=A0A2I0J0M3_PUNGR|nr:hypothetical protein CRG98_029838 [Punica granatum]
MELTLIIVLSALQSAWIKLKSESLHSDEIDFELFGNDDGSFNLSTNIFTQGNGVREQEFRLWFDPTTDFHSYAILWNAKQIGFFVDNIPIRVYQNVPNVPYLFQPMKVLATIWEAKWFSEGRSANWAVAPFVATYMDFVNDGCQINLWKPCSSIKFWWNKPRYWRLDAQQLKEYEDIISKYLGEGGREREREFDIHLSGVEEVDVGIEGLVEEVEGLVKGVLLPEGHRACSGPSPASLFVDDKDGLLRPEMVQASLLVGSLCSSGEKAWARDRCPFFFFWFRCFILFFSVEDLHNVVIASNEKAVVDGANCQDRHGNAATGACVFFHDPNHLCWCSFPCPSP